MSELEAIYEDEHLLVVDKPAGLVVHPARGHRGDTLVDRLVGVAGGGSDPERPGIVHRLDRDTSGLILVAKTEEAHRKLSKQITDREVTREYLALVEGRPSSRSGTIDAPVGRDRRDRTKISLNSDRPRGARTHFVIERELPDTTLLRVTLETGRTHQIRVHMQAIGHPVVGDPQYGGKLTYGLKRQFLHATKLSFVHPITGEPLEIESPLPSDLSAALNSATST